MQTGVLRAGVLRAGGAGRFHRRGLAWALAALLVCGAAGLAIYGPGLSSPYATPALPPDEVIASQLDELFSSQLAVARLVAVLHANPIVWSGSGAILAGLLNRPPLLRGGNILVIDPGGHVSFSAVPGGEGDAVPVGRRSRSAQPALMGVRLRIGGPDGGNAVTVQVTGANAALPHRRMQGRRWFLVNGPAAETPTEAALIATSPAASGILPAEVAARLHTAFMAGGRAGELTDDSGTAWSFRHLDHWPVCVVVELRRTPWLDWRVVLAAMLAAAAALATYGVMAKARNLAPAVRKNAGMPIDVPGDERAEMMAGGIAHEMNNVLAAVSLNLEAVTARDHDPMLGRLVDSMLTTIARGTRVNQHLLAFAGRQDLLPLAFDLGGELVRRQEALAAFLLPGQMLLIAKPDRKLPVRLDPNALIRALAALLHNAATASDDAGRIEIDATLDPSGRKVRLRVIDRGVGMLPAVLHRAADPFFTTRRSQHHLGLGLSVAGGFARQSGGALTLESRPGLGTTATLLLPLASAGAPVAQTTPLPLSSPLASSPSPRRTEPARVLVVEDNALLRSSLVDRLRVDGYEAVGTGSASEALRQLDAGMDILMTDVVLGGAMDGVALALRARAARPFLPLVFISGFMSARLPELLAGDELAAFLRKPVGGTELNAVIAGLLALRDARRQQAESRPTDESPA